jgi:hypothetical protein
MKKLGIILFVMLGFAFTTQAQVDTAVNKAANKTAEVAVKGKSAVVDKVYKNKVGPEWQSPIYIDGSSKYYYIDKKGHKQYVPKSTLKDKPKD